MSVDYIEHLKKCKVPEHLWNEAILSIETAKPKVKKVLPYKLSAPFVMAYVVQKLAWEAEELPEKYKRWGNNISINGDNIPWISEDPNSGNFRGIQYLEDTPEIRARTYWAKGHHPRSKWARYIWLGFRNTASAYALELGAPIQGPSGWWTYKTYATPALNENTLERSMFHEKQGVWQFVYEKHFFLLPDWKIFKKLRPKLKFAFKQNLGHKVNIHEGMVGENAMAVWKSFAVVRAD